jgi:hypothetical protein
MALAARRAADWTGGDGHLAAWVSFGYFVTHAVAWTLTGLHQSRVWRFGLRNSAVR